MPELPDLQVFSRNVHKRFAGKKLVRISVINKSKLKIPATKLKKAIEGTSLKKVFREGKELRFQFSNGAILGMHLMLHGKLDVFEEKNEGKYAIVEMLFSNGQGLVLSDYQRMANVSLNPEEKPAPDALSDKINFKFLKEELAKKKTNIKNFLMDQNMIRGIGNAYADEILWKAGIAPQSICNKIPDGGIRALAKSIPAVLKNAEKQIAKKDPDIISGEIRDFFKIHNAKKKQTPSGGKIHNTMLNSRITYYSDEQELFE